ncbi:hypothetical protein BDC45DRAFT_518290 [Circinella umbellata]|nr:hypothetical protein BDC45DRAFT_518290 [Circinella umbellata]
MKKKKNLYLPWQHSTMIWHFLHYCFLKMKKSNVMLFNFWYKILSMRLQLLKLFKDTIQQVLNLLKNLGNLYHPQHYLQQVTIHFGVMYLHL